MQIDAASPICTNFDFTIDLLAHFHRVSNVCSNFVNGEWLVHYPITQTRQEQGRLRAGGVSCHDDNSIGNLTIILNRFFEYLRSADAGHLEV